MCGIVGTVERDQDADPGLVQKMADAIAHRGPDGEGIWTDGNIGLGSRRLKVIDLSERGHMPMVSNNGRFVIVYNGEVYNFRELRTELEKLGHTFRSDTDTEVVLEAWAEWGADALPRFNGMFAFAIADLQERAVHLCRDRAGVKPLYVTDQGTHVMFGSEIKSFLEDARFTVTVDAIALRDYFAFQNVFSDRTLFAGVRILAAGHRAVIQDGRLHEPIPWWDLDLRASETNTRSPAEAAAAVRTVFEEAVARQLVSDVPVGSFLSGGMDSGSIVALARQHIPALHTFTAGFDVQHMDGIEANFDEREAAATMADHFETQHHELELEPEDMQRVLLDLAWHQEDPRVGNCWQDFLVTQHAKQDVTVCLSGAGGDELFGGYPWRYARVEDVQSKAEFIESYNAYWQRLIPESAHADFFTDDIMERAGDHSPRAALASVLENAPVPDGDWQSLALYFEFKTFLHGLLVMTDKMANAHSLEVRVPLIDNDLIDLAASIPATYKISGDTTHRTTVGQALVSTGGKQVLRDAMDGLIPEEIRTRKKQGFAPPDGHWFRTRNRAFIAEFLLGPEARSGPFIKRSAIENVLEAHNSGSQDRKLVIWSLLVFEAWCRRFRPASFEL